MKDAIISARNSVNRFLYGQIAKRLLFAIEPETVHDMVCRAGILLGSNPITRNLTSAMLSYSNRKLEQEILGIKFQNPIGLAAGFDKDAKMTKIIKAAGFGFEEVGSITGEPCQGNPKPRLWRLKKSRAIIVNYGLKNDGCGKISRRLRGISIPIPLGTNIAKTNSKKTADLKAGIEDYAKAYSAFADIGSYSSINISCPNAFGGEQFTSYSRLNKLLERIGRIPSKKPVFIKISPDLSMKQIDAVLMAAKKHRVAGIICGNLTKRRDKSKIVDNAGSCEGGVSGKPVEELSNECIRHIYLKTKGKMAIIGCGGVFSAKDAYKKIRLGASLVQLITGMVFEGPQLISEINLGLVKLLNKDGFGNISEAIGKDAREEKGS